MARDNLASQTSHASKSSHKKSNKMRPKGSMPSAWFSLPTEIQAMEDGIEQDLLAAREENREKWSSQLSFLLATVGSAVGLGNIWKFPSLVAKYGGGAFIVAYILVLLFIGLPMMTLELTLGQKFQGGDVDAFGSINPRFRGIGIASVVCSFIASTYYTVILSWAAIYFFESFIPNLPYSIHSLAVNGTANTSFSYEDYRKGADAHFSGIHFGAEMDEIHGSFNWRVFGALLFIWVVIYLCIFKGIRAVSHIVKFTATAPVFIILVLAAMGYTKDGAIDGIKHYIGWNYEKAKLELDWSYLNDRTIWIDAIGQVFFSLSLCMGSITAYSSFNPKHQNIARDGKIICFSDMIVSIMAGISVYEMLGFVKNTCEETALDTTECQGIYNAGVFNLAFVSYPVGISMSSAPNFWGILFFGCLLLLGIDSAFSMIIAFTTVLDDAWFSKKLPLKKPVVSAIVCGVGFLLGFVFLFDTGYYFMDIVDNYLSNWCLMLIGFVQAVACGWFYQAPYQFRRVGKFSVALYDLCFFVAITLGVIIALSGNKDSDVDVIWVGVFIGMFVWIFGLVSAVLLSKGRVNSYREKIWCIAGWHGPDMIRRMVNKQFEPEWEPNSIKDEGKAFYRHQLISMPFGFLIKYLIPMVLLLLVGLALSKDLQTPYMNYNMMWNLLGILVVAMVLSCMVILFLFPRLWYDSSYAGNESWISWVFIPKSVRNIENEKLGK